MGSATGGAPAAAPAALRVQTAPQQNTPLPQPDMSKTTMTGHTYGPPQNPAAQSQRPQYQNFQYRPAQHGSRPSSHPRQQQPFIPGASASASGPVLYHPTLMFPPHMGIPQSYQQPRSQGYYQYMPPYINYANPTGHTPQYYFSSNGQQLPTQSVPAASGTRSTPAALVPAPAPAPPAAAPPVSMPLQQTSQPHMHQTMAVVRQLHTKRQSHRIPIIHPETRLEVLSDEHYSSDNHLSSESSDRQTPQPEPASSVVEEFNRKVTDLANQPSVYDSGVKSNYTPKNIDSHTSSTSAVPQTNAIISSSVTNSLSKPETLSVAENKNLGPDVAIEHKDTPVVSAISNSPVIVPKMSVNLKQLQKNNDQSIQPLIDTNKVIPTNKKQKSKPIVPHVEELDKPEENPPAIVELAAGETDCANGPTLPQEISSADNLPEVINFPTSQSVDTEVLKTQEPVNQSSVDTENITGCDSKLELNKSEITEISSRTATEILSASIEKVAKDIPAIDAEDKEQSSSAIQAQAKLTQSIASCTRANQPVPKMKDVNLNSKTTDPDIANGNSAESTKPEPVKEDINKNEKSVKNLQNKNKKSSKMSNSESNSNVKETDSCENGKDETDKVSIVEEAVAVTKSEEETPVKDCETVPPAPVFVPKYKYAEDQWSPINKTGKKCYDILFLKQIKEDPKSKDKPNVPRLEEWNVMRTTPIQEHTMFQSIMRPINDSLFFPFSKSGMGTKSNTPRDAKKDGRNMGSSGNKGSMKLSASSGGNPGYKPVIHMSITCSENIRLNETENAWKPSRYKKLSISEEEHKCQELYSRFRGILNKLTPQKFDTLLEKVKSLEINTQKRLEGVIDLVFEKAIDEPNFSEAYAVMCNKLGMLKVPVDNATSPDQFVNFRALIISKCQKQFETKGLDEQVIKLEKDINESTDPAKKKELQLQLEEENRRVRMRSVGNVRFIGELYKLKMLTFKIMVFCMNQLIDKLEEEKLECLCKLLTTIGQQIENEAKEQLDTVFKKMQDIVDKKSNKISSRVRFMIQDVIELRAKRWQMKSVVDTQPKMMDQIQKEAEQQQRHIELMNASPMGGFRREDGGRGKRSEGRRQNAFMDNSWKTRPNYTVDTSKFKVVSTPKNITNIKLAPQNSGWNQGSGTKHNTQTASNSMISLTKSNIFSALENVQTDPTSLRGNKETPANYSKGASIERSTFKPRGDLSGGRSGSTGVAREPSVPTTVERAAPPPPPQPQEPLSAQSKMTVRATMDQFLLNCDEEELVADVKQQFSIKDHAGVVAEILEYIALEKSVKEIDMTSKGLLHLVSTNTISATNFVEGLKELFECAPDIFIDVPMLYDYFGKLISPQIEKKNLTFSQTLALSKGIIAANQGHLLLKAIIKELKESMGSTFVKTKWQESGILLNQWMHEDQVSKWIEDNKFEFLEGGASGEDSNKKLTPTETQHKLLQLMNSDENKDTIKGWIEDKLGDCCNEEWFVRALTEAVCEHALFGAAGAGRGVPRFSQERINKYAELLHCNGGERRAREAACLSAVQHLIHRLEHPQGLTLEIFQYLHEQYIISVEGFTAWEETDAQPEGKAVMLKALTSFFTNIKEADNEDSGSED